jgi:hypothetical protein
MDIGPLPRIPRTNIYRDKVLWNIPDPTIIGVFQAVSIVECRAPIIEAPWTVPSACQFT